MNVSTKGLKFMFEFEGSKYYRYGKHYIQDMGETATEIDFEQFFVDYMLVTHNPLFLEMNKSYVHLYMSLFGVPETLDRDDLELFSESLYMQEQDDLSFFRSEDS